MLEMAILGLLLESPMHGYELRKRLTGLLGAFRAFSYGSLYPTLRRMQADGLIERTVFPTTPPSVEYRLSPMGYSFLVPLSAMVDWAFAHFPAIREAREALSRAA